MLNRCSNDAGAIIDLMLLFLSFPYNTQKAPQRQVKKKTVSGT
jgi:hypothetical protein